MERVAPGGRALSTFFVLGTWGRVGLGIEDRWIEDRWIEDRGSMDRGSRIDLDHRSRSRSPIPISIIDPDHRSPATFPCPGGPRSRRNGCIAASSRPSGWLCAAPSLGEGQEWRAPLCWWRWTVGALPYFAPSTSWLPSIAGERLPSGGTDAADFLLPPRKPSRLQAGGPGQAPTFAARTPPTVWREVGSATTDARQPPTQGPVPAWDGLGQGSGTAFGRISGPQHCRGANPPVEGLRERQPAGAAVAEGEPSPGRGRTGQAQRNHYEIAYASAIEACAALDLVDLPGAAERQQQLRAIGTMLTGLMR